MKKTKTQKGITLVALIITVVIMMILASVTINQVTGDGTISKAEEASNNYEIASEKEKIQVAFLEWQLSIKNNEPTLSDFFEQKYQNVQVNEDGSITVILTSGNKYIITENGEVTFFE